MHPLVKSSSESGHENDVNMAARSTSLSDHVGTWKGEPLGPDRPGLPMAT